jgi:hypothetical protein
MVGASEEANSRDGKMKGNVRVAILIGVHRSKPA